MVVGEGWTQQPILFQEAVSSNSRLKAFYIIGQRKVFCIQMIPEASCTRKYTVDIDILVISRNGGSVHLLQE